MTPLLNMEIVDHESPRPSLGDYPSRVNNLAMGIKKAASKGGFVVSTRQARALV
jgi:hypothetical protein